MSEAETKKVCESLDQIYVPAGSVVDESLAGDLFTKVEVDQRLSEAIVTPRYSYWKSVFKRFFSSKVAVVMLFIFVSIILMALIHPMISHFDNMKLEHINNRAEWFQRPSWQHPFGTDDVGRDMFSMVWAGARISLFIAVSATFINLVIGVIVGMWWGFSKRVDAVMIEVFNIIANVPFMLIVMVLCFTLGAGVWQLIFALCCTSWIGMAYFTRVQVMIRRDREYNMASKCLGSSTWKIIKNNIFPYLISVLVTVISRDIPSYISYEVFLSFIGIGLSEKVASLGRVVQGGAKHMQSAPYIFVIPLIITALISVSLYIAGQTLADASDPRTHMV